MNAATSVRAPIGKRILSACMAAVLVASLMPAAGAASATEGEASEAASGNLAAAQISSQATQFTTQDTTNPNITTTKINTTYQQTDARAMLSDINTFRADNNAWQYDKNNKRITVGAAPRLEYDYVLEQAAMIRAVEISQLFEHTRPNGQYCTSLHKTSGTHGENIAYGQGMSRERAMQLWKEDGQLYNGQGHRRNMQNKSFRYVAVSHAKINGWDYWVQEFGSEPSANYNKVTTPDNSTRAVEIEVPISRDAVTGISDITSWVDRGQVMNIYAGESIKLFANVTPTTALNKGIKWEVTSATMGVMPLQNPENYLTIGSDGLCMSNAANVRGMVDVTVQATAAGNPTAVANAVIMISPQQQAASRGIKLYNVTYDTKRTDVDVRSEVIRGGGTLYPPLDVKSPDGDELEYWCTDSALQHPITASSLVVNSDMTYYAKWKRAATPDPTPTPDPSPSTKTKMSAVKITAPASSFTYTGKAITPKYTLTHGGKTLVENTDYTVRYSSNTNVGTATVEFTGKGSYEGTERRTFRITAQPNTPTPNTPTTTTKVSMYRLYNKWNGEHFYTSDTKERSNLIRVGWNDEGVGWTSPSTGIPVYRLYNPYAGDHHYTTSASERNACVSAGWRAEGVGWYSDPKQAVPLYREYNPYATTGTHNYTTSRTEHNALVKAGWRNEGVAWYGVK